MSFHFLTVILHKAEVLILMNLNLSIFPLCIILMVPYLTLPNPMSHRSSPKSFIVLHFIFRSMIYYEFSFA